MQSARFTSALNDLQSNDDEFAIDEAHDTVSKKVRSAAKCLAYLLNCGLDDDDDDDGRSTERASHRRGNRDRDRDGDGDDDETKGMSEADIASALEFRGVKHTWDIRGLLTTLSKRRNNSYPLEDACDSIKPTGLLSTFLTKTLRQRCSEYLSSSPTLTTFSGDTSKPTSVLQINSTFSISSNHGPFTDTNIFIDTTKGDTYKVNYKEGKSCMRLAPPLRELEDVVCFDVIRDVRRRACVDVLISQSRDHLQNTQQPVKTPPSHSHSHFHSHSTPAALHAFVLGASSCGTSVECSVERITSSSSSSSSSSALNDIGQVKKSPSTMSDSLCEASEQVQHACLGQLAALHTISTALQHSLAPPLICFISLEAKTGSLIIGRFDAHGVQVVSLPIASQITKCVKEWNELIARGKELLTRTMDVEKVSKWTEEEKKMWWAARKSADAEIEQSLSHLECILGEHIGLLLATPKGGGGVNVSSQKNNQDSKHNHKSESECDVDSLQMSLSSLSISSSSSSSSYDDDDVNKSQEQQRSDITKSLEAMKVVDIRNRLKELNLSTKGLKPELVERLTDYMISINGNSSTNINTNSNTNANINSGNTAVPSSPINSSSSSSSSSSSPTSPLSLSAAHHSLSLPSPPPPSHEPSSRKSKPERALAADTKIPTKTLTKTKAKSSNKDNNSSTDTAAATTSTSVECGDERVGGGSSHVVLILDELVQAMPWECLPSLRNMQCSRVPGFTLLLAMLMNRQKKLTLTSNRLEGKGESEGECEVDGGGVGPPTIKDKDKDKAWKKVTNEKENTKGNGKTMESGGVTTAHANVSALKKTSTASTSSSSASSSSKSNAGKKITADIPPSTTSPTTLSARKCWYAIDPEGNLPGTRSTMTSFLQTYIHKWGWRGIVAEIPPPDLVRSYHNEADLFLYCGHGAGEKLCDSHSLRKCASTPASMLWGCSSGRLAVHGVHDPYGTTLSYLLTGASFVIANLWDVTDKDIDRLSIQCMSEVLDGITDSTDDDDNGGGGDSKPRETVSSKKRDNNSSINNTKNNDNDNDMTRGRDGGRDGVRDGGSKGGGARNGRNIAGSLTQARESCKLKFAVGCAPVVYGIPVPLSE